jgi:hypothetical protein
MRQRRGEQGGTLVKHAPYGLAALSLLGAVGLAPRPAQADIDFKVTTVDSNVACILIQGPWSRDSGYIRLNNNTTEVVYSAVENLFSPYGDWVIGRFLDCDPLRRIEREVFCVDRAPVELRVSGGNIDFFSLPKCGGYVAGSDGYQAAASAYLGGESARPAASAARATATAAAGGAAPHGGDSFRFEGKAGDTIELVLDRDGAQGSAGKLARLSLRQVNGAALGQRQGAVPLKLAATLPAAGGYVVHVAEVTGGPGGEPFRGYYQLRVDSASDAEILLEPLESVEP